MMHLSFNEFHLQVQIEVWVRNGVWGVRGLRKVKTRSPAHDHVDVALAESSMAVLGP